VDFNCLGALTPANVGNLKLRKLTDAHAGEQQNQ